MSPISRNDPRKARRCRVGHGVPLEGDVGLPDRARGTPKARGLALEEALDLPVLLRADPDDHDVAIDPLPIQRLTRSSTHPSRSRRAVVSRATEPEPVAGLGERDAAIASSCAMAGTQRCTRKATARS